MSPKPPFYKRFQNIGVSLSNVEPLIKQTKAILQIYNRLKWIMSYRQHDLRELLVDVGWNDHDTGIAYITIFAPEIDMNDFEAQVRHLMENKLLLDYLDMAILRLKQYPNYGHDYYDIIYLQYLSQQSQKEAVVLEKLHMDRSTFYRRKKEALFLLGLCLFGFVPLEKNKQV